MNDLQDIITANNHAFLVALVREQAAKLDAIDTLATTWERIPALRKGTAAAGIRAALEATK